MIISIVRNLWAVLGIKRCECLCACHTCHALTGCDATNSLSRTGKTTDLTRPKSHLSELKEMANSGLSRILEEVFCSMPSSFMCKKKDSGCPCTNLDKMRYIPESTTDLSAVNLPQMADAFQHYVENLEPDVFQWAWCALSFVLALCLAAQIWPLFITNDNVDEWQWCVCWMLLFETPHSFSVATLWLRACYIFCLLLLDSTQPHLSDKASLCFCTHSAKIFIVYMSASLRSVFPTSMKIFTSRRFSWVKQLSDC